MGGILFFVASILFGIGLVRKLLPFANGPERLFWGTTLGILLSTWLAYSISRLFLDVNQFALITLTGAMWITVILLFRRDLPDLKKIRIPDLLRENKLLVLLLILVLPIFIYFFYVGMFRQQPDGLYLTATSWYDMALHVAIANGFVYGDNFPPMYLVLPGEPLRYPFLPDFHASIFLEFGWSLWTTFAVTSLVASIALVGTFFCFARRVADSASAAFLASLIFLFNGGLGFILFFRDWYAGDRSLLTNLLDPKENYTDMFSQGIKWVSLITSGVIPQRAMLYGMPIAFFILALITIVWRDWSETDKNDKWNGARILFIAGILTGLLPLFHVHSYMSLGLISGFLFMINRRYAWIAFWIPAVLLALPQLLGSGGGLTASEFLHVQLGWMSGISSNFFVFLLFNFGLPLLLIVPALFAAPRYLKTLYFAFACLFVFSFIFRISPNDFDNIKLLYYWHAGTAILVANWLSKIGQRFALRPVVAFLVLVCVASGLLATIRETKLIYRVFSPEEIEAGIFARDKTPPRSLFLTGQNHNQPVLCLAGKPIMLGFEFWIMSHGYSRQAYDLMLKDVKEMYSGSAAGAELLTTHKIDYVYISQGEKDALRANEAYFAANHTLVYKNSAISIYQIKGQASDISPQ
ncbi:MAG: hypothetical protein IPG22_15385 [Acidobacteria bacterium]|nr:hypothetical protein [Acidobacteriota bacterium]